MIRSFNSWYSLLNGVGKRFLVTHTLNHINSILKSNIQTSFNVHLHIWHDWMDYNKLNNIPTKLRVLDFCEKCLW